MTVELSKSRDNQHELAKELGIRPELIYRWRTELLKSKEGSFPGPGKPKHSPEEAEIARLKKQLREVELERDILKKAGAAPQCASSPGKTAGPPGGNLPVYKRPSLHISR